jgi:CheY-like chemotaxis protein
MPLRALVVDDERPALEELRYSLREADPTVEVETAATALDALRLLKQHRFDAVFVDIQMPGLSGLELVDLVHEFDEPPAVVFVTAYEEYALRAFELRAVDYLLKPVALDRLRETLERGRGGGGRACAWSAKTRRATGPRPWSRQAARRDGRPDGTRRSGRHPLRRGARRCRLHPHLRPRLRHALLPARARAPPPHAALPAHPSRLPRQHAQRRRNPPLLQWHLPPQSERRYRLRPYGQPRPRQGPAVAARAVTEPPAIRPLAGAERGRFWASGGQWLPARRADRLLLLYSGPRPRRASGPSVGRD